MALTIKTWSGFSKRVNSTKQPLDSAAVSHTVLLKEGADLKNPVFELNTLDFTINYVQAFDAYYFAHVENIDGHRCNIICSIDYLATFKTNISSYTCYVERSASGFTPELFDPLVHPTGEIVQSAMTEGDVLPNFNSTGHFVVTAVGKSGLCQYVLSETQVNNLFNTFFDPILSNYLDTNKYPHSTF